MMTEANQSKLDVFFNLTMVYKRNKIIRNNGDQDKESPKCLSYLQLSSTLKKIYKPKILSMILHSRITCF